MAYGEFDYVIAGGGTAGCVLAARLSADPAVSVLLLEAGGHPDSIWTRMPAGAGRLFVNPRFNWGFMAHAGERHPGRELYLPQGKVLGGSSTINGLAFVRGHAQDFDRWRDLGAAGWDWNSVLPWFVRLEHFAGQQSALRGGAGPLRVAEPTFRHPSSQAYVEAAVAAGLRRNPDYNGPTQEGAAFLQFSVRNGKRDSAYRAWLRPALGRPNLVVSTFAHVHGVQLERGRAVGVRYASAGQVREARARREVIVSGGAIGSPRILLHSGIGPAADLERAGVPVLHDLPGVGRNLIDHPYLQPTYTTVAPRHSLNRQLRGWRVFRHGAQWVLGGGGPLTIGASQAVAFVRLAGEDRPGLQINFRPISFQYDASGRLSPDPVGRVTAAVCVLRPRSRGSVSIASPDPAAPPNIHAAYLEHPADVDAMVQGLGWMRRIFGQEPLRSILSKEDIPGPDVCTPAKLGEFARNMARTMCHPVGSCRMGTDDLAVVDPQLRVRGIDGLRVIDASVMPDIVSGNTAAATYMIGERGADLVRTG
ncbi:MAG: GMC family oxidoreductase N-terminal domain-containing protein [Proteobacteria bacterium]|nr:GMC family oxidoreductase N-terminal domain-containing protein [Pseudomonadota bacterium]